MNNVFITGAAGFIGSYVVEEFVRRGWHVTALIHRSEPCRTAHLDGSGRIAYVRGDATSFDSLKEALDSMGEVPDAIVHCAGRASDTGWRSGFRRANLDSVAHLVKLAEEMDVGRFVFMSTTDVYGLQDFNGESEDELPLKAFPRNPYPEFKILAEEFIRRELEPDRFSILRPAQVWGVGDSTLSARIVDFLRWSPWIVHFGRWKGTNRWPLAHVRNVAMAAYLAAVKTEWAGRAVNIIDDERTSIDEFYRILAAVYLPGKRFESITLPFSSGFAVGAVVSGISNLLNLARPFMDPSLYALYAVSRNLDFSNARFRELAAAAGEGMVTMEQGVEELGTGGGAWRIGQRAWSREQGGARPDPSHATEHGPEGARGARPCVTRLQRARGGDCRQWTVDRRGRRSEVGGQGRR